MFLPTDLVSLRSWRLSLIRVAITREARGGIFRVWNPGLTRAAAQSLTDVKPDLIRITGRMTRGRFETPDGKETTCKCLPLCSTG